MRNSIKTVVGNLKRKSTSDN